MYLKTHTIDHCDSCSKKIGRNKLFPVPFIYCNKNDKTHADAYGEYNVKKGYKQYYVCKECYIEVMETLPENNEK